MERALRRYGLTSAVVGLIGFAMAAGAPSAEVAAATPEYPPIFRSSEVRSTNLRPFPKWTGVLERYFDEIDLPKGSCTGTSFNQCYLQDWKKFLDGLAGADPMFQLDQVNNYMNQAKYITDPRNYTLKDYWATPRQFFNQDGDCEDYAIAKFMSLRALGWDNEHMRIVVVQDLNLRIPHAILVAYKDGAAWVLDNQVEQLITADRIRHYRPFFSMNEDSWWLHRPKTKTRQ